MNDFKDEILVYLNANKIIELLSEIKLPQGEKNFTKALLLCYRVLIKNKIFNPNELKFLKSWINDIKNLNILSN